MRIADVSHKSHHGSAHSRAFWLAPAKRGFTLVELLVVIVIITILAALIVPVVMNAIRTAKLAAIKLEVDSLQQALEQYAVEMGEYPPDFSDVDHLNADENTELKMKVNAINAHLSRKFRNRNLSVDQLSPDELKALNPTTALYFWLRGFSNDPSRPLTGAGDRTPRYEFKDQQLVYFNPNGVAVVKYLHSIAYYYPGADTKKTPYLYYRANKRVDPTKPTEYQKADQWVVSRMNLADPRMPATQGLDVALPRPYFQRTSEQTPIEYASNTKFQIISASIDGEYGVGGESARTKPMVEPFANDPIDRFGVGRGVFPAGPYDEAGQDNITNFTTGSTLEDSQP